MMFKITLQITCFDLQRLYVSRDILIIYTNFEAS